MGKYRKILVAFDGSEAGKNALREAFKLARDNHKWITVITINPPYRGDLDLIGVSNISELLKGSGEKILAEAREIAETEGALIKTRLEEGEIFEKIIEVAEEERCDLIVMGRQGITNLKKTLMGSVTAKVIGHFQGKILVVPENATLGWKNILVGTDGSRYSDIAIEEAVNYARSYGGVLKLVQVVDVTEEFQAHAPELIEKLIARAKENLKNIKQKLQQKGINVETFVREGEPYKIITELATDLKSDVIVLGSHGKTGLHKLLMGSVTERVIGYSPCPVLIVKAY
jgi:hypothetical protein